MLSTTKEILLLASLLFGVRQVFAQPANGSLVTETVILEEDFSGPLNNERWAPELEAPSNSSVQTSKGKLVIDASAGVTVWCKQVLNGNIRIEYDWTVLVDGGKNDRLSDFNQFWMASDPRNTNLFTRSGRFDKYDSLRLYYVGFGGNGNTTTRFRKYHGDGQKPVLKEYLDKSHLLVPNRKYHIAIAVKDGRTTFAVDGEVFFDYTDQTPLKSGYFGFRSTSSRHAIDNFRVYSLSQK